MNTKNLLAIWTKRAAAALALLATVGLMLPSCEKEKDKHIYRAPYEKELFFNEDNMDSIDIPIIQQYVKDTACKHIYMSVKHGDVFTSFTTSNIVALRNILKNRIDISNNISGRGNLVFRPGKANM